MFVFKFLWPSQNIWTIEVLNDETYAIEFGLVSFSGPEEHAETVGICPTISILFQSGSRLSSSHKFFPTWFENIPLGLIFNSKIRLKIITIFKVGCIIDALVLFWSKKTSMRSWSLKVHISHFFSIFGLYAQRNYIRYLHWTRPSYERKLHRT